MKIKTIVHDHPDRFDDYVNPFLEKGYLLEERGVMPVGGDGKTYHYARLVLLDPPAEPEQIDPIQALHIVKEACLAHTDHCNKCPMWLWCEQLRQAGDPTDWELPEVEA